MKNKKKFFGMVFLCMFLMGATVYADTITFDVTVNKSGVNEDNYSRKVNKGCGSVYENRYYVTPKEFVIRDKVQVFSRQEDNVNKTSYPCTLAPGKENVTLSNPYTGTAPCGVLYRLRAYFGGTSGSARVKGNFTP